jgi:rhamnose utilization protein RhaD (predicted bifunctional aldolase and dehydrogenase)/NAD(P)-dependent dehydrogenase (short-subunit alcohol dehydrogenase family)
MNNRWNDSLAQECAQQCSRTGDQDLADIVYASRIVGGEPELVLYGGGNTSLKCTVKTLTGDDADALYVKASGFSMETIGPEGFVCLDLDRLKNLRRLESLSDEVMAGQLRLCMLRPSDSFPSIETLMHAFIDKPCIIHTHPNALLCLTNRENGEQFCREALGNDLAVIAYANAGLSLAREAVQALATTPKCRSVVVMHHGLITWGSTPKEAYDATIEVVSRAERYLEALWKPRLTPAADTDVQRAQCRYRTIAPIIRKLLSPQSSDPAKSLKKMYIAPLITKEVIEILGTPEGRKSAESAPLTPDYLIRTKKNPLLIDQFDFENNEALSAAIAKAIDAFSVSYKAYIDKYSSRLPNFDNSSIDLLPRVAMLPGLGAICAGPDMESAILCRTITEQALRVKGIVHDTGGVYRGLADEHLFDMEFRAMQRAKVQGKAPRPLIGSVAIVTGAAGAIGIGICEELLEQGCAVAVTDLPGKQMEDAVSYLKSRITQYPERVIGVPLDVTDTNSVANAFDTVIVAFGGIDIVVINAGLAHVSTLVAMDIESFKKLERVNIEGTLHCLAEAGRRFKIQGMGGDIVLISTKNVFSPGAGFGAYSATKAAAHQLCRIASLELADIDVRVNMVAPDAVFSHGSTKSGLWAEVGPGRMKARGLDEKGLEEYYRKRNLLHASVTAGHVAKAVMFFVTRQTPTTGATIPVDGGLPDATPR